MNKHRHSRREFLGLTGAGVASLAAGNFLDTTASGEAQTAEADPRHADLVVFNAKVYTVDSRMPKAEAFGVSGGRFVYVGSTAEAKVLIGGRTQAFDAKQMTIVPGFIDCHITRAATSCSTRSSSATPMKSSLSPSPASSINSVPKPRRRQPASGSMDIFSTTRK